MQKKGDKVLYAATDITNFIGCRHASYLEWLSKFIAIEKSAPDEQIKLIQDKGLKHERDYLNLLKSQGRNVLDCSAETEAERLSRTEHAISSGAEIVYQAALNHQSFTGYADFLVKVNTPSKLGDFSYEPLDTKLAGKEKSYFVLQLCLYAEMLQALQGLLPANIHVVLGKGQTKSYPTRLYWAYFNKVKSIFLEEVSKFSQTSEPSYPEPCAHCQLCPFSSRCEARWREDDHLALVANISRSQIQKLRAEGINSVAALAATELPHITKMSDPVMARLKTQAALQVQARAKNEPVYHLLRPEKDDLGFIALPPPSPGDLFYDIEGDPLIKADINDEKAGLLGGLEYLHGVYYLDNGTPRYKAFWALEKGRAEQRCFEELMDFFEARLQQYPDAHIYHYAPYEISALKRLMCQYGTREAVLDNLLRSGKLIDLYKIVRHSVQVSEERYSIKNLETFYMDKRAQELKSGGASVVWFEEYLETGDEKLKEEIEKYNETDCESTYKLREWLLKLKEEAKAKLNLNFDPPRESLRESGEVDPPLSDRARELEAQLLHYREQLCHDFPDSPEKMTPHQRFRELLYFLADYYRREAKPGWWEYYSRAEKTDRELIEDTECLGAIELDKSRPPEPDKKSLIYTYLFPQQETKLAVDKKVKNAHTRESMGTITELELDAENPTVRLRIGKGRPMPDFGSVMPDDQISTQPLHAALLRFLDETIANFLPHPGLIVSPANRYAATLDLLLKRPPRIENNSSNAPVISVEARDPKFPAELVSVLSRLQNSYLFIQGPPGTGKTFTASHAIVSLLQSGQRIGISSNSHKAINNLLEKVVEVALERGFSFRGVKKSSNDDQKFEGRFIDHSSKIKEEELLSYQLFAGTPWLFSSPEFDCTLDYVFIDEAGQLSLAHTIATATSARNVVLLGDPMQLSQPSQGIHPGESGLSTLEFLLQSTQTVPPTHGIFLETTHRMHGSIASLLSDQIYDGRLETAEVNNRQSITHKIPNLPPSGIGFIPVAHSGNSGSSTEEAEKITEIVNQLLNSTLTDKSGTTRPLTLEDILIVAPYNLQVGELRRRLLNARIGTIDKFQGQEAAVSIVSMTTSSGDELPRNMEFLFSKNRLNVAISRAQALSIVVASPELLKIQCRSVDQMALVNTLCAVESCANPG